MNYNFLVGFSITFGMLIVADILLSKKNNREGR